MHFICSVRIESHKGRERRPLRASGLLTCATREEIWCPALAMRRQALACWQDLGNRSVSLVVDAKQRVVHNRYGIVTLAILAKRQATTATTAARPGSRQRVQIRAQTSTAQPLMQALVEGESASNIANVFKLLCDLAESTYDVKLRGRVLQVHKDFALGIEAARKDVFPASRSCNDFPHLMRAARRHVSMVGRVCARLLQVGRMRAIHRSQAGMLGGL